ncbi:PP2C family protein-serine/threonine phosphatase [Geodermatophilus sp. SYSU D01036]
MIGGGPRRLGVAVAVVILAAAAVLAWLAAEVNARAEAALLQRQVAQAGAVLTTQISVLQTQLADAGQVATATATDPGPFGRFAEARVAGTPGMSLALWRIGGGAAERVAVHGPDPVGPPDPATFLAGVPADGTLAVTEILPGQPDRLGYALRPAGDTAGLVIYAESALPPNRRVEVPPDEAFGGLDFAVYLGGTTATDRLLYATGPVPIGGDTAETRVPFGYTGFTVVGASPTGVIGGLARAVRWIVLGVGAGLAAAAAGAVAAIGRRRVEAERLAAENERLFHQQRGIAGTLQHALLPELPRVDGVEVAARYVAGVDELDVGGDWYDVIPRGPGCAVFVVGDISGRGLDAATTMAALRFAVRAHLAVGDDIATVAAKLRPLLHVDRDHRFATVLLGELDAGRLRVICAGHFPPLLLADGEARLLDVPVDPPIGVDPVARLAAVTVPLPASGTLLAFTDGLVDPRG